jgi:hypothetical protein
MNGKLQEELKTSHKSGAFAASAVYRMLEGGAKFACAWNLEFDSAIKPPSPDPAWLYFGFTTSYLPGGIPRSTFNVMKCYSKMKGPRVEAVTSAPETGFEAFARRDGNRLWVLAWWYLPEPKQEGLSRPLTVEISGLDLKKTKVVNYVKYLIDAEHSNYKAGLEHQELEKVAESTASITNNRVVLDDTIGIFSVVLYEFQIGP